MRPPVPYALRKQLWAFTDDRIAVRFQYEIDAGERRLFGPRDRARVGRGIPLQ